MVNYFQIKTKKPPFIKGQDFFERRKVLDEWQARRPQLSDSLYKTDKHFSKLLNDALNYAEKNKVSNGDLEDFTAKFISPVRALELMRQNRQVGSCSFDNGPIIQQRRIAALAAKTSNWDVFIKSFFNIMNDNVARNANSNIASNARSTYIEELTKLDIDINKLLLGSNIKVYDTINKHYFSDGNKIAKAYTKLDVNSQTYFENTLSEIIKEKKLDAFNKLHFFNTYNSYRHFTQDSVKKNDIDKRIKELVDFLPIEIKSRIKNPNKQLQDLLYKEKEELEKYDINSSMIAHIGSYSYDGECWSADLVEKNSDGKTVFDLMMPIGEEITPLKNFTDKKNVYKSRIEAHTYLQKILYSEDENKLYVKFTADKSFVNKNNRVTEDMSPELLSKLDFKDAMSIRFKDKHQSVRFILLNNNNLLLLDIPKNFKLPNYSFKKLMTKQEKSFLSISYKSFKLFDIDGIMLN